MPTGAACSGRRPRDDRHLRAALSDCGPPDLATGHAALRSSGLPWILPDRPSSRAAPRPPLPAPAHAPASAHEGQRQLAVPVHGGHGRCAGASQRRSGHPCAQKSYGEALPRLPEAPGRRIRAMTPGTEGPPVVFPGIGAMFSPRDLQLSPSMSRCSSRRCCTAEADRRRQLHMPRRRLHMAPAAGGPGQAGSVGTRRRCPSSS